PEMPTVSTPRPSQKAAAFIEDTPCACFRRAVYGLGPHLPELPYDERAGLIFEASRSGGPSCRIRLLKSPSTGLARANLVPSPASCATRNSIPACSAWSGR